MALYLPESVNLEDTIKKYPPYDIKNFKKDKLIYILDLITKLPSSNRKINLKIKKGFVPLSAKALQDKVPDYSRYLEYLIRIGVIKRDSQYITGKKCRGYRFTERYNGKVIRYKPTQKLRKNSILIRHAKDTDRVTKRYPYLMKWFNDKFKIGYACAEERLHSLHKNYLPKGETEEEKERNHVNFYNSHFRSITDFYHGDFWAVIDDFGLRLHTNLTNLSKQYRTFITYAGEKLVSIDIGSSQPYLSTILLNEKSYLLDTLCPGTSDSIIPCQTINQTTKSDLFYNHHTIRGGTCTCLIPPLMLLSFRKELSNDDVAVYKNLVASGELYDYFAERVLVEYGHDFITHSLNLDLKIRNHRKELFFKAVYAHNGYFHQHDAAHVRVFKQVFPTVYQIFYEIKRNDKDELVRRLQRYESHIVLNTICKNFTDKFPNVPIFTIHDSMITITSHLDYLTQIAEDVLTDVTGIKPLLRRENWKIKQPAAASQREYTLTL